MLILRNEAGTQLVRGDDQATTYDPSLEYTVPSGVTALVAAVSDLQGRGGPDFVYRLAVTPLGQPDFSLAILDDRPHVPRTGTAILRVRASRTNYDGPIKLSLPGLPAGVTVSGDEIPVGATDTLLSLTAPEGTALAQTVLNVIGTSTEPGVSLQRLALLPETPLTRAQPWLAASWRSPSRSQPGWPLPGMAATPPCRWESKPRPRSRSAGARKPRDRSASRS